MGRKILAIMLIVISIGFPLSWYNVEAINLSQEEPFFKISILSPGTSKDRYDWPTLIAELWPRIGIGIEVHDETTWNEISPRIWNYPGPFPIPTYAEGGYDVLFVGWSWGLDWYPMMFGSPCISPSISKTLKPFYNIIYQYFNEEMDWAIYNYTYSHIFEDKLYWGQKIQEILYRDLPQLTIFYPTELYTLDQNFDTTSWNDLLWSCDYQSMENWSIVGQSEFRYAIPSIFNDFHIYKQDSKFDAQWLHQIYNGLIKRVPNLESLYSYEPNLATDLSTIDGSTYIVNLKPNVTWADGTPLNASDIEYSFKLRGDLFPTYSPIDYCYYRLDVTIIDEYTLEIDFIVDDDVIKENILALPIIPKHIWQYIDLENQSNQAELWATTDPTKLIGAGPYYLFNYNDETNIIHLKRNDYYKNWTGTNPYFEDIYFEYYSSSEEALSALSTGIIDMVDSQFSPAIEDIPTNVKYVIVNGAETYEVAINYLHPIIGTGEYCPISSPISGNYIRKAMCYMIPRDNIIEEILDGFGTIGVTSCPRTSNVFNPDLEPFEYNIDLALECMEKAGYDIQLNTVSFGYHLPFFITLLGLIGSIIYILKRKR